MNKKDQLVVFATSLSQVAFAVNVLKNQYVDHEKILILADPATYNMIPRDDFSSYVTESNEVFDRKIYLNSLMGFKELSNNTNFIEIGNLLEAEGISLRGISDLFIGLLSTRLYIEVAKLFFNANISLIFDGMMSFGPLRGDVFKEGLADRIKHVYYEDLCAGVVPKYLPELPITPEKIDVSYGSVKANGNKKLLVALQSFSYSRIMSEDEEYAFYQKYIDGITRLFKGYEIYILPHPNNASKVVDTLNVPTATWLDNSKSGEDHVLNLNIGIVTSVFSTLMFRASKMGAKCFSFGTDELLLKLRPYENSNRIPVILSRYCFPCFDELPEVGSRSEFINRVMTFEPNVQKLNEILGVSSVLVKPSLNSVLDLNADNCIESLSPFERGLLLAGLPVSRVPGILKGKQHLIRRNVPDSSQLLLKIKELEGKVVAEKGKRERIKNSLSWKITKPIRYFGELFKK